MAKKHIMAVIALPWLAVVMNPTLAHYQSLLICPVTCITPVVVRLRARTIGHLNMKHIWSGVVINLARLNPRSLPI
jgi:hypothetical protein